VDLFNYNFKETIEFALTIEIGSHHDGKKIFEWKKVTLVN